MTRDPLCQSRDKSNECNSISVDEVVGVNFELGSSQSRDKSNGHDMANVRVGFSR